VGLFGGRKDEQGATRVDSAGAAAQRDAQSDPKEKASGARASGTDSTGSGEGARKDRGTAPQIGGNNVANIGKSIVFKGELSGDEDLVIDGSVEGRVQLPSHQLTVGAHGKVTAQIQAKSVIIVGTVAGNVNATERVEVQASGVVDGDICSPRLLVQEGAAVNGAIEMGKTPASATTGTRSEGQASVTGSGGNSGSSSGSSSGSKAQETRKSA
jgi:cytoskeletal protein CcmA (bactofilin family)